MFRIDHKLLAVLVALLMAAFNFNGVSQNLADTQTSIPSNSIVISEVRNDNSKANVDWVELYNTGTAAVGLRDWELSLISGSDAAKTDKMLVGKEAGGKDAHRFPKNTDFKLQPGAYLLILNQHPADTVIADGFDIDAKTAGPGRSGCHQYIVREQLNLPNENITLILRNALDKNSHHNGDNANYATSLAPSQHIMDYAGNVSIAVDSDVYNTRVWPFRGWTQTVDTDGKNGEGIPYNATESFARKRYRANDGHHKNAWDKVGYTDGIGYDLTTARKDAPGTPGYPNTRAYARFISISEVMYDAGPTGSLPQWIELYNRSKTAEVNLKGWEMEIRNATGGGGTYVDASFIFGDAIISPNRTLLLVSQQALNDIAGLDFSYNLQAHSKQLGLSVRRSNLLSPTGFYLRLINKKCEVVDEAGNVRVDGEKRLIQWALPDVQTDARRSLVRRYGWRSQDTEDVRYYGKAPNKGNPTKAEVKAAPRGWNDFWRKSDRNDLWISTFYGHRDDIGTPGYRPGSPLPVSLSSFRPVRDDATGHVVVRWVTESELNNAGFNILRSETKGGAFEIINVKGIIAGHGTTSERHVYTYTDTTAKPNVVYYYQIEDVSLDGKRTRFAPTHLRGNVNAAGKLATTWGDVKSQQ